MERGNISANDLLEMDLLEMRSSHLPKKEDFMDFFKIVECENGDPAINHKHKQELTYAKFNQTGCINLSITPYYGLTNTGSGEAMENQIKSQTSFNSHLPRNIKDKVSRQTSSRNNTVVDPEKTLPMEKLDTFLKARGITRIIEYKKDPKTSAFTCTIKLKKSSQTIDTVCGRLSSRNETKDHAVDQLLPKIEKYDLEDLEMRPFRKLQQVLEIKKEIRMQVTIVKCKGESLTTCTIALVFVKSGNFIKSGTATESSKILAQDAVARELLQIDSLQN